MTVKQNRLQSAFIFSSRTVLCIALCLFGTVAGRPQTVTPRLSEDAARLELIGGPAAKPGLYLAGVAITMATGSHTYWKLPGDAGVPPTFDFAGSQNVRSVHVLYPAPRRIAEEGLEAFGYIDAVVFPVEITAADPTKSVVLNAEVAYAVCNKICIPVKGHASVTLGPGAVGSGASRVEAALAEVPRSATAQERAALSVALEPGTSKPTWTLTWRGAESVGDIFADAPDGVYLATRKLGPATWRLVAEQLTPTASAGVPVTLILANATRPIAIEETLDMGSASR